MRELWELTASEAARLIRARAISPEDLLKACVGSDRHDRAHRARVGAPRPGGGLPGGERARAGGRGWADHRALHGVPVALKDPSDASGLVTTAGAGALAHRLVTADATISAAAAPGHGAATSAR